MEPPTPLLWRLFAEAMVTYFRRASGWQARLTPTSALVVTGSPRPDLNLMTIDDAPDAAETMRAYAELLIERGLPFVAFVTDAAEKRVWPVIDDLQMKPSTIVPLMTWRPRSRVVPGREYEVSVIDDEAGLWAANQVLASAFDSPADDPERQATPLMLVAQGVTRFLAHLDGVPVSAVSTTRAGPIAGIWAMGTARRHQGKGAGRSILDYAIAHEQAAGAEFFFLGATPAGRPLYERVGFREVASATLWVYEDRSRRT